MADLKTACKSMKAAMDAAKFGEALAVATPLMADAKAMAAAEKDVKQRPLLYTLYAFAGLAHNNLKQMAQAEASYLKATRISEEQFPAWKGLYDVYTQTGAKDKIRGVLEKLVPVAPASAQHKHAH